MKEHPILFSGPLVRAILEGRKTQTRRIVKDAPEWATEVVPSLLLNRGDLFDFRGELQNPKAIKCPYGAPGDRLWVRETWCLAHPDYHDTDKEAGTRPVKDGRFCFYAATDDVDTGDGSPWKPSIHMPRWASRITLEVTAVRAERLQEISDDDAKAEGVEPFTPPHGCISPDQRVPGPGFDGARLGDQPHRLPFAHLWDDINGDRATWASNPWVWVVEFKRIGGAP